MNESTEPGQWKRNRVAYGLAACAVIALGLASRRYGSALPPFLKDYSGDALWALMVFVLVGLLAPRWPSLRVAGAALLFAYAIEFSQLYQAAWINNIRHTRLGGLVLGFGFLWSDLLCYTVGVGCGLLIEMALFKKHESPTPRH